MHPYLIQIGSKTIPSYGFFLTLGYLASILVILILSRKQKLPLVEITSYALFGTVISILGAKIYIWLSDIIRNFSVYVQSPKEILRIPEGGGGFYGGLILGILFSIWYLPKVRLPFWKVADIVGAGTALGYSLSRIGCFMAGCCYGRPSSLPWAVSFPPLSEPVHPTQLYDSGLNFMNFLALLTVLNRKKFDGQVISLDIIINSGIRFFVEFYRGDAGRGYVFQGKSAYASLSIPQLICLIGVATGISLYLIHKKRAKL